MELTPQERDFHLAEFTALKKETSDVIKAAAAHFRWAGAISAAVLAWLSTEGADVDIPPAIFLAPAAITLVLGGLSGLLYIRVEQIGHYLLTLESLLGRKPGYGWEEAFAKRKRLLSVCYAIGWLALFGADVYAGLALQAEAADDQQYDTRSASMTS